MQAYKLPFFTLLLLISFAAVNAVLFTPALPNIAMFFKISEHIAELTVSWYLVGYSCGQLLYGPIASRFGKKPAMYVGIIIQIISSIACILSAYFNSFHLLVIGRVMIAIGAGVGLKMTFALVNECYEPKLASKIISYLMLAFAIAPGLSIALGGFLNAHLGWTSCFYAGAIYGLALLFLTTKLPATQEKLDLQALEIKHLLAAYVTQFKNKRLVSSALLMGTTTSIIYIFAAIAPFIAIKLYGMSSQEYGLANCLPPIGLILGSLLSAYFSQKYKFIHVITAGILLTIIGVVVIYITIQTKLSAILALFFPMILIYFGICFILANASVIALRDVEDKAHGSAVMSFINMGFATLSVFIVGLFTVKSLLLPYMYATLCCLMIIFLRIIKTKS